MVCDRVLDCPEMDDEEYCRTLSTPALLYCRYDQIYIHQRYVCDGVIHCLQSQDDEASCLPFHCPRHCICRGYSIYCNHKETTLYSNDIPAAVNALYLHKGSYQNIFQTEFNINHLIVFDVANSQIFRTNGTVPRWLFKTMLNVFVVDLTNTSLQRLERDLFAGLTKVEHFNIQDNNINQLCDNCFYGLRNIQLLNLHNLSVQIVYKYAFVGLQSLTILNLSSNHIYTLAREMFFGLGSIETIDIRNNMLRSMDMNLFVFAPPRTMIMTTDNIHCCYISSPIHTCRYDIGRRQSNCKQLLTSSDVVIIASAFGLIFLSTILGVYHQLRTASMNAQVPLLITLAVQDLVGATVLLYYVILQADHTHNYPLEHSPISSTFGCKVISTIIFTTALFPKCIDIILTVVHYRITKHALVKRPYSIRHIIMTIFAVWTVVVAISIVLSRYVDNYTSIVCVPFGKDSFDKSSTTVAITSLFILSNVALLISGAAVNIRILQYLRMQDKLMGRSKSERTLTTIRRYILVNTLGVLICFNETSTILCYYFIDNDSIRTFVTLLLLVISLRPLMNFTLHTRGYVYNPVKEFKKIVEHIIYMYEDDG